jgi:hypothetical protein
MRYRQTQRGLIPLSPEEEAALVEDQAALDAEHKARAARRGAYPSIKEQLAAMWKGGEAAEDMRARVAQFERDHPKPG